MTRLRYDRAPSASFLHQVGHDSFRALLQPRRAAGLPLDLQLREGDRAALYCGRARILTVRSDGDGLALGAHPTYASQPCARALMRTWRRGERGLEDALGTYLGGVAIRPAFTAGEGAIQARWMQLQQPWIPLDREAIIGGGTTPGAQVQEATRRVRELGPAWRQVQEPRGANEVDLLAIDPAGRVVLVELKKGRASDLYHAPLQLLRYAWEWAQKVGDLLPGLQRLVVARQHLGLLPVELPALTGALRLALAWGEEPPSTEVLRRLYRVRDQVERFLPPGTGPMEMWHLEGGGPAEQSHMADENRGSSPAPVTRR